MTTTCHDFAPEEVMARRDGELPAGRAEHLDAHLRTCAACRNLDESLRVTSEALAAWRIPGAPSSFVTPQDSRRPVATPGENGSPLSWGLFGNRRALLTFGLAASTLFFVVLEIYNARMSEHSQTAIRRGATIVDIGNRDISKTVHESRAGGGGDGSRLPASPTLLAQEPGSGSRNRALLERQEQDPQASSGDDTAAALTEQAPLIARTAELQIIAAEFDSARSAVESALSRHHGYAASLNAGSANNTARTLNASLRIPSRELPGALAELKTLGHVTSESQSGEEVTAEHADLVARLKNSRESETRLRDILRNRTGKVSDVLEVEQEMARVRGEIEQMESQREALEHRVDFATINLTITEEYKAKVGETTPGISTQFHNAAVAGYENIATSALGLGLWCTEYLPPILFWLVLLLAPVALFWRWRRRSLLGASPLG
jgi:hypothetical protein